MKKLLALILALAMVLVFTACDGSDEPDLANEDMTPSDVEEQLSEDVFKVGVIYSGDPASGSGYSYTHDQGIIAMQNSLGLSEGQIVRKINVSASDADSVRTAMEECIDEGCEIIFGTSGDYMNVMASLAKKYPDIIFSNAAGSKSNDANFNNYSARIYQAFYLTGIAAGMKTESGKIGFVAAMDSGNSEVTACVDAFAMGVERVNPEAKVYVKITGVWSDAVLEQQTADALIDIGCDVIAQHCDTPAPQIAAESRQVWSCGYNNDMGEIAPEAHLTAPIWNWGIYYTRTAKAVMEKTWTSENYYGGMDDGLIDISALSKNCADGTKEAVAEAKAEILSGHDVFSGEIIDNQGNVVCAEDETLDDETIVGGINWYYRNVEVM
ncbi:MAG: BMP family ABC transporter substrate-binding protein [Clostridia bacterium]